jgi:hypothetical protein
LILSSHVPISYSGEFDDYLTAIKNECPNVNQLTVKKSMIELVKSSDCNSVFTTLLLKDCTQLNCSKLIRYWGAFNSAKAGAILGK